MTQTDIIKKIIDDKFFNKEQRQLLAEKLDEFGPGQQFFNFVQQAFEAEVKNRANFYATTIKKFDAAAEETEKRFQEKRAAFGNELSEKLRQIDQFDLVQKEKLWDEYDKDTTALQNWCEKELQAASAKLLLSMNPASM